MIIAVLEWNSDSGAPPIVLVAEDLVSARRAAVKAIAVHLPISADVDATGEDPDGEINYIRRGWVRDNPLPTLDDDDAVAAWLAAFKEETTDLWLSLYAGAGVPDADDFYVETRTNF